ncbi:hypothetical protein PIB30_096450, partial [Stylosanthes scabra]|nr:hypothetical protein [Stylosanthes scabra]
MEDRRLSLALSSHSSSSDYGWDYDVFLSFRGPDTGKHFAGNLYYALTQRGIRTFYADKKLNRGEELQSTLLKRIQESKVAIPIFSKDYADSAFCLIELEAIMDTMKAKGRLVFPVFFGVSASVVRFQTGSYKKAMAKHEGRYDHHIVQKWREALHQASNLSGNSFHFKNEHEHEFELIEKITEAVSGNVNRSLLCVAKHPVGLELRMQHVCKLLDVVPGGGCNNNEVRMVGIHGIGGIGKSTLAKAVFNYIADQFDGRCFLENVRENSSRHGLEHLQEKLLYDMVGENNIRLVGTSEGVPLIKHRLHQMKVLLILDDVDQEKQLQELAGGVDWFGPGSRVIITTRDQQEDARKLFEWKLNKKADPHFDHVINRAVTYCAKLPLALEIISSDLATIDADKWESALGHYERTLGTEEIYGKLKRSFDRLEKEVQNVFLDIACCLKGLSLTEVNDLLSAHHRFCPEYHIPVLVDKSLIKIENNVVKVHDKIHEMGRKIEQEGNHGYRYHLSSSDALVQIFKHKEFQNMRVLNFDDAKCVKAIPSLSSTPNLEELSFSNCESLTEIDASVGTLGRLKILNVSGCNNLRSFPPLNFPSIEELNFRSCSNLESFPKILEKMETLTKLALDYTAIKAIPDLFSAHNLVELSFSNCVNLIEVDVSVGFLSKLRLLKASGCCKLRSFPSLLLPSLEELDLSHCSSLEKFPEILDKMDNLSKLNLDDSGIKAIPDLFSAHNLVELSFSDCVNLIEVDVSVGFLSKLRLLKVFGCCKLRSFPSLLLPSLGELDLSYCSSLEKFPEILDKMENMTSLRLVHTPIKELPNSIQNLSRLQVLDVFECGFHHIPLNITLLPELRYISFFRTPKPDEGEETVSWMKSSNGTFYASQCTISDGIILPKIFGWFSMYMEELVLSHVNFTFLPDCIMECLLLKELNLNKCHKLQQIRWFPPNLETLFVTCCRSLQDLDLTILPGSTKEHYNFRRLIVDNCQNLHIIKGIPPEVFSATNCRSLPSSYQTKLFIQEEDRNIWNIVPGNKIPECFHCSDNGNSISFWFRNKFPAISLCVVLGARDEHQTAFYFCPKLEINGKTVNKWLLQNKKYWLVPKLEGDHIFFLHDKQKRNENSVSVNEALVGNNGWVRAKIFVDFFSLTGWTKIAMQIGIRVLEGEDVRFSSPYQKDDNVTVTATGDSCGTSIVE